MTLEEKKLILDAAVLMEKMYNPTHFYTQIEKDYTKWKLDYSRIITNGENDLRGE